MKALLAASLLLIVASPQPTIPSALLGTWKVGRAYDTQGPTDLDEPKESKIKKSTIEIASDAIKVCGKTIPIKSTALSVMTYDQFATRYHIGANRIGLIYGGRITELVINSFELTHACGEFSDPGTDIIFDEQNHFAIQVDNAYYELKRAN
ncbi:MAG TPA: hypothetical protein VK814_17095 [Acidobacteriaceae bacterium]|jgi:hypothetical protein|nr:hypothetical protein [Acidobacteriaceae bacterium]